jgi:transcriptional regulator with XRE-family HTH domain
MKDQIIKLMETEGLAPAKFADRIGVQRSSISHILSGRNKPSYDFIMKILSRFPGIDPEWLLTGRGSMIKSALKDDNTDASRQEPGDPDEASGREEKVVKTQSLRAEENKANTLENAPPLSGPENKQMRENRQFTNVNYVLVFYNDGTFQQYTARE